MSLRTKFGVLIGALALAVGVTLGVAGWSVVFLERELSTPLADTERLMTRLAGIKRAVGTQHNLLASEQDEAAIGPRGPQESLSADEVEARFGALQSAAMTNLEELGELRIRILGAGVTSHSNLSRRLGAAYSAAATWFDQSADPESRALARAEALAELFNLHELIERIEGQSIADARVALQHGQRSRNAVIALTSATLGATILTGVLAGILMRRWVMVPIARLRTAAERLASGALDYRIEVEGKGELALLSAEVNQMARALATIQDERIERERLAAIGGMTRRIVHNLRSPLAGVRMLAELTRLDLPDDPHSSPLRENQDRIIATVDRFEAWISDLLSLTRPLELSCASRDAAHWAATAMEPLRATAQATGCTLQLRADTPTEATFDASRLEQALVALGANAIEASPPGGLVTIEVAPGPPGRWRLAVLDQGPGVSPEHADAIFRPYFTTKEKGNGIGLAMAHRVVREHGGELRAEPAPGGGAAFVADLPVCPPPSVATGGQPATTVRA